MRSTVRSILRIIVVACLAGAIADLKAPWRSGPRTRIYVVDASASMTAVGEPQSLTIADALKLVELDLLRTRPDDRSTLILVGARTVIADLKAPVLNVDPMGTDLDGALRQAEALAGDGDIVVLTDGRAPVPLPPRVPTFVIAAGPVDPIDARISAVQLPPFVRPGETYTARVSISASGALRGKLLGRDIVFDGPGTQDFIFEGLRGPVNAEIELADACTANNALRLDVLERDEKPRVLLMTDAPLPIDGDRGRDPTGYDVIVLNNVALAPRENERLAAAVRSGAGLVILGGSNSYAGGRWAGTPLESVSPLWAFPDDRVALVVVLDCSGSMNESIAGRTKMHVVTTALGEALSLLKDDDELAAVPFPVDQPIPFGPASKRGDVAETLRRIDAGGPTEIAPALKRALDLLQGATAGRKHILLLSDCETEESPEALKAVAARLGGVGLTIVGTAGTRGRLEALGGDFIGILDLAKLDLAQAVARSRGLELQPKAVDAGWPLPERINRTTAKQAAEIVARADGVPLLAIQGRVAAATFAFEQGWAGGFASWTGLADLVRRVTPTGGSAHVSFDGDELVVRTSKPGTVLVDDGAVPLVQRGSSTWEGRLRVAAGTHIVRVEGRVAASAVLPCPPELAALGVDAAALDRIGTRVTSLPERRGSTSPLPLRGMLLIAALVLFLADIAVDTFWR